MSQCADEEARSAKRQKTEVEDPLGGALQFSELSTDVLGRILQYSNVKDLAEVACVSRKFRQVCKDGSLPQERWGTLTVVTGSFPNLLTQLKRFEEQGVFSRFSYLRLRGVPGLGKVKRSEVARYLRRLELSVTRLDISLHPTASKKDRKMHACIPKFISAVMPNLKEIDMSHAIVTQSAISDFSKKCPNLERFTWNCCKEATAFVTGQDFRFINARSILHESKIREVFMDDAVLYVPGEWTYGYQPQQTPEERILGRLESDESLGSIFSYLSSTLERVSIKNLGVNTISDRKKVKISQKVLIKFVRSMPHLVWLRSDLNAENVAMLQAERPEIVFVSE